MQDFEDRWNFPHCLSAIDGKHINMQAPANSGSLCFNYKKSFSIVLLAVCNGNYQFTMLDIGDSGHQSGGDVFAKRNIGICIKNQTLDFPEPGKLYVIIGDDAFPMGPNLMKPCPQHNHSYITVNSLETRPVFYCLQTLHGWEVKNHLKAR